MSLVGADHRSCPSSGCCRGESQQGLTWSRADEANHKLCWNYLTPNYFSSLKLVSPSPGLLAGILGAVNVWVSVCNRCINKTQQRNCYRVATVDRILWYRCWMGRDIISWWWFQLFFIFTPTWRNNLIWLYNIFQMGWNQQLDLLKIISMKTVLVGERFFCRPALEKLTAPREQSQHVRASLASFGGPVIPQELSIVAPLNA